MRKSARNASLQREGGTLASEKAVTGAMRWLANHQLPDGSWSFDHFESPTCHSQCRNPGKLRDARFAATGFALLPYIGAGQTHKAGKYKATVRNGLYYLINHMKVTARGGALNDPGGNMYSHGICTIALCEAYAVSHDKALLVPAQQAVNFICWAQDPVHGGWRYQPREPGDTSVLGWQLMALKSAYMANLRVPAIAVRRASNFLDFVQLDSGARYGYTSPSVVNTDATTAIGVLCRMYLGWKRDSIPLQRGVEYISSRGPSVGNLYFNYYGTQVMRHWEGEEWKKWNRAMRDQLAHGQTAQGHEDGSWYVNGADQARTPAAGSIAPRWPPSSSKSTIAARRSTARKASSRTSPSSAAFLTTVGQTFLPAGKNVAHLADRNVCPTEHSVVGCPRVVRNAK